MASAAQLHCVWVFHLVDVEVIKAVVVIEGLLKQAVFSRVSKKFKVIGGRVEGAIVELLCR